MKKIILLLLTLIITAAANFGFSQQQASSSDKIVIVLDIQEGYTNNFENEAYDPFIKSVNKIISCTKPDDIIYVAAMHKAITISFKGFKIDTLVGSELSKELLVVNDNLIIKDQGNAFAEEELLQLLKEKGSKDIVVTGLLAEKCVSKTLLGGIKEGFEMYVIPEAIIGSNTKKRDKALKKLYKKGITELSLEEYCN